jgi:hypothetical protein
VEGSVKGISDKTALISDKVYTVDLVKERI